MKTKVLVLHTSVGHGIMATARNVREQLIISGKYNVRIEDIENVEGGATSSVIRKTYLKILDKAAGLWGFLYSSNLVMAITLPLRKFTASFKSKRILGILREFQPAIVISTQTVTSGIVAYLKSKGLYKGKLVIVFSDYHLHRFWLYDEADLYICNIQQQAEELKQMGVPADKIKVTGTLIAQKFFQEIDREEACTQAGLLMTMPTVLMGGAGSARESMKEVYLQLLRSPKSFQIAVVCGNNVEFKEELQKISAPSNHPVKIFGYVDNMEVLMSASSVLVYKTGGPTMAEAVVKKLPMVITDVRPGHELVNLNYLLAHGLVQYGRIPREVVYMVEQILDGKIKIDHVKNYETIVHPKDAVSLVEAIDFINPEGGEVAVQNYQNAEN